MINMTEEIQKQWMKIITMLIVLLAGMWQVDLIGI
jgi:hypothetical protein